MILYRKQCIAEEQFKWCQIDRTESDHEENDLVSRPGGALPLLGGGEGESGCGLSPPAHR